MEINKFPFERLTSSDVNEYILQHLIAQFM